MNLKAHVLHPERLLNLEHLTLLQKRQFGIFVKYLKILGIIAGALYVTIFVKNQTLNSRFQQRQHEALRSEVQAENRKLMIRYAAATDPVRVERIAREQIGMVLPERTNIHLIQIYDTVNEGDRQAALVRDLNRHND